MGYTDTINTTVIWETCYRTDCNVTWGMLRGHQRSLVDSHATFYCPNGHGQHYTGKSDAKKLQEAQARETHLRDQLKASLRSTEAANVELLRVRSRIANGVCPCCRRTFQNVAQHMTTQHPEFAVPKDAHKPLKYRCSCGDTFSTFRGLRTHQGHLRRDGWDTPGTNRWSAHLTYTA